MLLFTHCDGALYCPGVSYEIEGCVSGKSKLQVIATYNEAGERLNTYPVSDEQIQTLKCEVKQ